MESIKVMDGDRIKRSIKRISHEILEKNKGAEDLILAGILRKGKPLAERISRYISEIEGVNVPTVFIDVTPFRDDIPQKSKTSVEESSNLGIPIQNKKVVLIDDVIYTGRTARAAMEALIRTGRPSRIQLAVLVDRGHRELPIRADFVGKNLPTSRREYVRVKLAEIDGEDGVYIEK